MNIITLLEVTATLEKVKKGTSKFTPYKPDPKKSQNGGGFDTVDGKSDRGDGWDNDYIRELVKTLKKVPGSVVRRKTKTSFIYKNNPIWPGRKLSARLSQDQRKLLIWFARTYNTSIPVTDPLSDARIIFNLLPYVDKDGKVHTKIVDNDVIKKVKKIMKKPPFN